MKERIKKKGNNEKKKNWKDIENKGVVAQRGSKLTFKKKKIYIIYENK